MPPSDPPTSQKVPFGGKAYDERMEAAAAAVKLVIAPVRRRRVWPQRLEMEVTNGTLTNGTLP